MADISLSKAVRSNLLSLQNTASMMTKTQERLATGNKVNSALDNPTNFFTASSLNSRASDLGLLMDSVGNAVQTIAAADKGIKAITKLVESAQSTARQALQDKSGNTTNATVTGTLALGPNRTDSLDVDLSALGFATGSELTFATENTDTGVSQSFTFTAVADSTVSDLVDAINSSGFANASISSNGFLSITGKSNQEITVDANVGGDFDDAAAAMKALGFATVTSETVDTDDLARLTIEAPTPGTDTSAVRADLAKQYDDLMDQISKLAEDSGFNGVNLLQGDNLKVVFNESGSSEIDITGVDGDYAGDWLNLTKSSGGFASNDEIETKLADLKGALTSLRSQASAFGSNLSIVETRQNFTKDMINVLQTGAANLTLADTNEEAANLLALQTRQSLSSTALSMASQADQSVLQLLR